MLNSTSNILSGTLICSNNMMTISNSKSWTKLHIVISVEWSDLFSQSADLQRLSANLNVLQKVGERIPFIQPHHLKGNSGRFNSATLLEEPVTNGHPPADDEVSPSPLCCCLE